MPAERVKRWSSLQSEKRTRERGRGREKRARRPLFDIFLWEEKEEQTICKTNPRGKKKEGRGRKGKEKGKGKSRPRRSRSSSSSRRGKEASLAQQGKKPPRKQKGAGVDWGCQAPTGRYWTGCPHGSDSLVESHVVHSLLGGFRISFCSKRCGCS